VADHLATTDIRELMRIQQVGAAADVSNVSACLQNADSEGSLFIRKVGRLHVPGATWRATPANEELLSPSTAVISYYEKPDGWATYST
jgi:hypothetical protein